jgi:GH24 family phage-related lysozyme (muramidase)
MGDKLPKAGQIKGVKEKPVTAGEQEFLESLPGISERDTAAEFIKPLENKDTKGKPKLTAHKDVNGQIIVGWGTVAPDLKEGDTITEADAQDRLNKHMDMLRDAAQRHMSKDVWDTLSQGEKDKILSVMHNTGVKGAVFGKSVDSGYTEFWKALISGDKEKAAEENDFGNLSGHKSRRDAENKRAYPKRSSIKMIKALPPTNVDGGN